MWCALAAVSGYPIDSTYRPSTGGGTPRASSVRTVVRASTARSPASAETATSTARRITTGEQTTLIYNINGEKMETDELKSEGLFKPSLFSVTSKISRFTY